MHESVFFVAVGWLTILLVVSAVEVIRFNSVAARILALDTLTFILAALLVVYAAANRSPYYMDAALVITLLAFVATLVIARYYGERKIF